MSTQPKLPVVAVRTLVEFAAKTGSLSYRYTPAPTGQAGIEGHQQVAARRDEHYVRELPLALETHGLRLQGRVDGVCQTQNCLEEIKTHYGNPAWIPAHQHALHWAQLKVYGWLYCKAKQLQSVNLALVYFELNKKTETRAEQPFSHAELAEFADQLLTRYCTWHQHEQQRKQSLAAWCNARDFPYQTMRTSQRTMAEGVYKAALSARTLLAEAPTGTGKTLAALFPALKAIGRSAVEKVFYLTCKTTGKALPLLALADLTAPDAPLRVLELTAKDKACLQPESPCDGASCPYAEGFFNKLAKARAHAHSLPLLHQSALAEVARAHTICPYYLAQEMARWADIIVADVNYYFDVTALLWQLREQFRWRCLLLVDEAHNLPERARAMYSLTLSRGALRAAKHHAPATVQKSLERLNKTWRTLNKAACNSTCNMAELPRSFSRALAHFIEDCTTHMQHTATLLSQHPELQTFFFNCVQLQNLLGYFSSDFCLQIDATVQGHEQLHLRNLIPRALLTPRFSAQHASACLFSATLTPAHFYQALLGLAENTVSLSVPSPFSATQLQVRIARHISTRYRDRTASLPAIGACVAEQLQQMPGNAIVFTSSYQHLQQLEAELAAHLQGLPVTLLAQSKTMTETERAAFINAFKTRQQLLGLAVLGGAFSEGVDLPGAALTGVFVATLGMPQVNAANEQLKDVLQQQFGQGFAFTYTFPGLTKVVQAAGRVIRTSSDRGYLWLLDDRFATREVQALMPKWWKIR